MNTATAYLLSLLLLATCTTASPPLQLDDQVGFGDDNFKLPQSYGSKASPRFRLPQSFQPINYKLDIRPILNNGQSDEFTAPGHVTILVKCLQATQTIVLHSAKTDIDEGAILVKFGDDEISVSGFSFNTDNDALTIELDSALVAEQNYTIEIEFTARVNDGSSGLYRSWYTDADGDTRYIATTQFEATGARHCFPCFDEPAMRATFNIRIGRDSRTGYHTLGNTRRIGFSEPIEGLDDWVWDRYEQTPNMPTYLIAIIVSNFVAEPAPVGSFRVPVNTWGPPNQMVGGTGVYSAHVQAKLLTFFEQYFDYPYQLQKMDSVAVENFAAGAMENWGLNTYRVNLMIFVEGENTQFEKWRSAAVISHELSHQWFGNLFTNNWWNDLWLKEGFARYLQFIGVDGAEGEEDLEAMKRVVVDTLQVAMLNDISPTTHPLHRPQTDVMLGTNSRIIYEKGASLIRTMQAFLTEEALISGLRAFLKKYEYSSAVQAQLFEVLTEHAKATLPAGVTVWDIMESWTERTGFPLIRVSRAGNTRILISQEKFYANGKPTIKELEPTDLWEVPVTFATKWNPDFTFTNWRPKFWIHKNVALMSWPVPNTSEWIVVNPDARSYYRVLYDEPLHALLKAQLDSDHSVISLSSRSQILDDYFASAYNNYVGIKSALDLTTFMHKETELVTWTTLLLQLKKPYTLLPDTSETEAYEGFKNYVLSKVKPQLELLELKPKPDDKPIAAMLRAQFLDWACSMDPSYCADVAFELFSAWMATPDANPITADVQAVIYCAAVASNEEATKVHDFIMERYNHEDTTVRSRGLLLNSLACHTSEDRLQGALKMVQDESSGLNIARDGVTLIQKVAENSLGRDMVFEFLTTEKAYIIEKFGQRALSDVVSTLSNYFTTKERVAQVTAYIQQNAELDPSIITSLNNSLARVQENTAWMDIHIAGIKAFLASLEPPTTV